MLTGDLTPTRCRSGSRKGFELRWYGGMKASRPVLIDSGDRPSGALERMRSEKCYPCIEE